MDGEDQHSGLAVLGGLGGGVALDEIRRAEFPEQEAQEQKNLLDGKVKELEKELDELLK